MASPAQCTNSRPRWAASTRCPSPISPAARAIPFGGKYLDLKPGELIRATDAFDDPNLPGEMVTTYTLKKVSVGTEVNIVQEGIPAAIPAEACYLGWQESLEN